MKNFKIMILLVIFSIVSFGSAFAVDVSDTVYYTVKGPDLDVSGVVSGYDLDDSVRDAFIGKNLYKALGKLYSFQETEELFECDYYIVDDFFFAPNEGVIFNYFGEDDCVVIPSKLLGYPVLSVAGVVNWVTEPSYLEFSEGIVNLGEYSFYGYDRDIELVIPNSMEVLSLTSLGEMDSSVDIVINGVNPVDFGFKLSHLFYQCVEDEEMGLMNLTTTVGEVLDGYSLVEFFESDIIKHFPKNVSRYNKFQHANYEFYMS